MLLANQRNAQNLIFNVSHQYQNMVAGTRLAGVSVSETADLRGFQTHRCTGFTRNCVKSTQTCTLKCHVYERGQRRAPTKG